MRYGIVGWAIGLAVNLAATSPSWADIPFASEDLLLTGIDGTVSVDAADFNRDGHMDLVVAAIEADRVILYLGGPVPSASNLVTGFDGACYVRAADLDNDGWTDVVASKRGIGVNEVRWWQNPGNGGGDWTEDVISTSAFTEARSVEVGDLDNDGDLDVVVAGLNTTNSYVTWFENRIRTGQSWILRDIASGFIGAHGAVVADINGDGFRDVAAVAYDNDEVAWFENDGTITSLDPWTKHSLTTSLNGALCVAAGDVDGDGDQDIITGGFLDDEVTWWENELDEGLGWDDHVLSSSYDGVYSLRTADLDADGDLDIVAAGRGGDDVTWFEQGIWGLWIQHDLSSSFDGARSAAAADFDGDGDLDVVAAGEFEDDVSWWENLSIHRIADFGERQIVESTVSSPNSVDMADLNQDGEMDIVGSALGSPPGQEFHIWLQDSGSWTRWNISGTMDGTQTVKVADINDDALKDVVAVAAVGHEVAWYQRLTSGFLKRSVGTSSVVPRDVDTGDLNCDGRMDLVTVGEGPAGPGGVTWWKNNSIDGSGWKAEATVASATSPKAIKVADVDRDGDPDLVVADDVDDWVRIYYNPSCTAAGWVYETLATDFDGAQDVDVADLNGDGWPDVVATAKDGDTVAAWLRSGGVWTRDNVTTTFNGPRSVGVADLDGDGDLDLAATSSEGHFLSTWENITGSGTNWGKSNVDQDFYGASSVALGDVDGDGAVDLAATASYVDDLVTWYENQGGHYMVWINNEAPSVLADGERAAALSIMPLHAGQPGDLEMELRGVVACFDDGTGTALSSAQANAIIDRVQVWYDASGTGFDPAEDVWLATVSTLDLSGAGCQAIQVLHAAFGNPAIGTTDLRRYFITVTTTADASSQPLSQFRVSHPTSSICAYYDYPDIWLDPIRWSTGYSGIIGCGSPSDLIFGDGFEEDDTELWSATEPPLP